MKKLLMLGCFAIIGLVSVHAQGGGGQFREMQKQRYKDSLNLTDAQIETVLSVQQEFMPKMMELRDLDETARATKMKEINEDMKKKLATALNDEALATKIVEFNARNRGRRGGGQRPAQNK